MIVTVNTLNKLVVVHFKAGVGVGENATINLTTLSYEELNILRGALDHSLLLKTQEPFALTEPPGAIKARKKSVAQTTDSIS